MKLYILTLTFICTCISFSHGARSPYDWFGRDAFDEVMALYNKVDGSNCHSLSKSELTLPSAAVSMVPQSNQLLDVNTRVYRNRTCLLALHDLSLSRGYFFSYVFKVLNGTDDFWMQPGLQYYLWRISSYVTAFPGCVNASGVEFDYNVTYPNWLSSVSFNSTIELFGTRATRNYYFSANRFWDIGPSMNRIHIKDIGSGIRRNYTDQSSGSSNTRYQKWLPDFNKDYDSLKGSYSVAVQYSDVPGKWRDGVFKGHNFFGPPLTRLQDNVNLPVKFTQPYFDCGGRNVWMFSAVTPIVDVFPRYRPYDQILEFGETPPRFVGVASMDCDWDMVDINPCPLGPGNPGPNIFAGTARCKPTTMCKPLHGWGFARGSYECVCQPGFRYPHWQHGPYQGATIEIATEEEYKMGFDCLRIDNLKVVPSVKSGDLSPSSSNDTNNLISGRKRRDAVADCDEENFETRQLLQDTINDVISQTTHKAEIKPLRRPNAEDNLKNLTPNDKKVRKTVIKPKRKMSFKDRPHSEEFLRGVYGKKKDHGKPQVKDEEEELKPETKPRRTRKKRDFVDTANIDKMDQMFQHIQRVKESDCTKLPIRDLILSGEVAYGAREQFQNQGRTALALSHFLSTFLQHVERGESHGVVSGDHLLNPELLHAEVLSHVMADHKIRGLGIWFDDNQYEEPYGKFGAYTRKRRYFAPYAFQQDGQYKSVDMAGDPRLGSYLRTKWFRKAKSRWSTNFNGLVTYAPAAKIRPDTHGFLDVVKLRPYPTKYKGAPYEMGMWTPPYFSCTGYVNDWVVSYISPFFGKDPFDQKRVHFKGVVSVDIKLEFLDINQCPGPFYMANAFKDTARCDYTSTYCVPVEGKRFERGAYKCECKQGYEYPFQENAWFFDGAQVEKEYEKKTRGEFNKFDHFKCRPGGASSTTTSWVTYGAVLFALMIFL